MSGKTLRNLTKTERELYCLPKNVEARLKNRFLFLGKIKKIVA